MNNEGQEGKYLEEENIFLAEEKKNREGKGGKHLVVKENIFLSEEKKNGEGKGGNIWRRKIYFFRRRRKTEKEKEEIFGEGKYIFFCGGEEEGKKKIGRGKYVFCGGLEKRRRKRKIYGEGKLLTG